MFVIGTAGHVDHGKSTLVQALTGIDPDRLQEEKARGMTIDLGFAWLRLAGGDEVSIVDVPGHERFIKNMLAGVGGIDVALLVIASDEGVMPQTREHLAILDLLGVRRGIVALTKSDLVDRDWLGLVAADVEEVLEGTTLEGAPIVSCSATTGEGLANLLESIKSQLRETPPKRNLGRPRLPIDRAFTVAGFGTVVTGTLIDGSLVAGQEVEVVPAVTGGHLTALSSRVRSLQTHRSRVETALPGTRTAVNLVGIDQDQLYRGQVVTTPGWLQPSQAVDVRLRALASLGRPLRHNLSITFHTGASETPAKLRLLEADEAMPAEEVWAQVRLLRPVAVVKGDHFVIRDANDTLGGGVVVETQARRHPRRRLQVTDALERNLAGSPADALLASIAAGEPVERSALAARTQLSAADAAAVLEELLRDGRAVLLGSGDGGGTVFSAQGFGAITRRATASVEAFLRDHPLRRGPGKEELRSRLGVSSRLFSAALAAWAESGAMIDLGQNVSFPGWEPRPTPVQEREADAYLTSLSADPFSPPTDNRPNEELVAFLTESGRVIDAGSGIVFASDAYDRMVAAVVARLRAQGKITLAEVRDLFGSSRKYVQAFLEHLDSERITIRRGDERVLGPGAR